MVATAAEEVTRNVQHGRRRHRGDDRDHPRDRLQNATEAAGVAAVR